MNTEHRTEIQLYIDRIQIVCGLFQELLWATSLIKILKFIYIHFTIVYNRFNLIFYSNVHTYIIVKNFLLNKNNNTFYFILHHAFF